MERPLSRRRLRNDPNDFGWTPRASQLAAPPTSSSPARQEERERRRRRRRNSGDRDRESSGRRDGRSKSGGEEREERRALPTDYRGALSKFSPPVPHTLLKKIGTKDVQGLGKVRVVLRVSPKVKMGEGETEVVTLDKRRRQVTLVDPQTRQAQESRVGVAAPKMFAFDQVYTQDDPQSEVVSGAVVDVLHAVLAGNDGCVLCFGGAVLGKTYTMLGSHTGPGELGVVPSAVAWLYRAIVEQKAKSGARFSVRVSAVAVDAAGAMLTDLLAEYAQEGEASPSALLRDTTGGYLSSVAELRAPSPEAAAHYLDVAVAARASHNRIQVQSAQHAPPSPGSATLLYTLHIYQYAVDKSGKGGVVGGRSRLHMIDMGDLSGSNGGMSLSALTSVLLAIFNGQRYLPNRESKLTMLLKEALGSVTCHAAMVVHISPSPRHAQHTLATLQLASRVHRMRRKKLRGLGGSGSGGSSEGSHGRSSGGDTSAGSSSMDFSSSEQSCDTVIYIGGGGPGDTTDNEHPPVFMPHHTNQQLWPITRLRSMEHLRPHSASPTPAHTRRAASASPTPTSRSVPNGRSQLKPRPPPRTVSNVNSQASAGKASPGGGFIRHQPGVSHVAYNSTGGQQPLLSSFKPQVTLGPLVPGDLRHFNYNAYEEPNNLVPIFQRSRLPIATQQLQHKKQLEQQQQQLQQQQQQQQQHQQQQQQQQHQQQQQIVCPVSQALTSLQPPTLAPAISPMSSTPPTLQPKTEVKMENSTTKKVNPISSLTNENNTGKKVNAVTCMPSSVIGNTTHMSQTVTQQLQAPTLNGTASSESGEVHDKAPQPTVNGTPHPVAPMPPNNGPPKAMVKPHVLTHVIEGFVIHEGKKTCEQTSTSPKGDTAKCEFCGKTDLRSKFKRSKRFCSTACAKRYNVGCSKRIGLFKNPEESPSKRAREDGGMEEADAAPQIVSIEPQGTETTGMEVDETVVEGDGVTTVESPSKTPRVDILKWTVKDVVDFIQNLPGCREYAEDFALQEIDGQALMLLKADHLMSAMSMKLGPALKICAKIESMRGDRKET